MNNDIIQHLLVLDRLLDAKIQDGLNVEKIRVLADRVRKAHPEFNKDTDILAQRLSNFLKENLQKIELQECEDIASVVHEPKVQRLYIDGCFDLMHSGHYNAIRQAKQLCETLVCGVISSEAIAKAKGPPIMTLQERVALVRACKWVDEIVEGVEYDPTIELLDKLNCSHVAHGDDLVQTKDGEDAYSPFKKAGRMKIFKRTEGISTTDIVGRLLLMTKETMWEEKKVFRRMSESGEGIEASQIHQIQQQQHTPDLDSLHLMEESMLNSKILNTTRRIRQFSNNKHPSPSDKIVYIDGSFDILHEGHIKILEKARELGDFLYVGVYDNETINKIKGKNFPILNLQERVLNLLAIKYVDEVIIGAPYKITENMIKNFKIQVVVEGSSSKRGTEEYQKPEDDPYSIPKSMGVYQVQESDVSLTADQLAERIVQNRLRYLEKFSTKKKKDINYEKNHEYLIDEI